MSKRERWIVYPLLFFSLIMGLKTSFPPMLVRARSVECRSLQVELINGRPAEGLVAVFDIPDVARDVEGQKAESSQAPADEAPADEVPADEVPADEVPADEVPADEVPADEVPADEVPADEVPSDSSDSHTAEPTGEPANIGDNGSPNEESTDGQTQDRQL